MKATLIVASRNPIKIDAARQGFSDLFGTEALHDILGLATPSGVADQPIGDEETLAGARNRAINAQAAMPDAQFWVGIEGGVARRGAGEMEVFAWIYIVAADGRHSKARTASFYLPQQVIALIDGGMELGEADDVVFRQQNSKQQGGSVGILTNGVVTRASYYRMAVTLAFIPFFQAALYGG